jgi:hypothetical protein
MIELVLVIRCDECGSVRKIEKALHPEDMENTLWKFIHNGESLMAVDSEIDKAKGKSADAPPSIFCSDECRSIARKKAGLPSSTSITFA